MKKQKQIKNVYTSEQIDFWMESAAWANHNEVHRARDGRVWAIVDPKTCEIVITRREFIADMGRGWN